MLRDGTQEQNDRVNKAIVKMKMLDIAEMKRAYAEAIRDAAE